MIADPSVALDDSASSLSKEFLKAEIESIQHSKNDENNRKYFLEWFKLCCTFVGELFRDHEHHVYENRMRQMRLNGGVLPPQVRARWGAYFNY